MSSFTNPSEIARETLRRLATQRVVPTPDNYRELYQEISGVAADAAGADRALQAIVTEIAREDSRVRLLTRRGMRGLAGAVLCGWQETDAEILGVMDADLQHPPELLPELWRELQSGADIVVASRYASRGGLPDWNRFRHLISQLAIWMTMPLQKANIRVKDPMSGFFLLRRACIQHVALQQQGFKILLEILVRGDVHSATEVPFVFGHRQAGQSKASLRVGLDYLALLHRLWKTRRN